MCPCAPPHNRSDRKAGDRATVTRCVAAPVFPLKSARSRSPSGFRRNRRRRISLSAGTWRRRTRLPVGRLIRETASPLRVRRVSFPVRSSLPPDGPLPRSPPERTLGGLDVDELSIARAKIAQLLACRSCIALLVEKL